MESPKWLCTVEIVRDDSYALSPDQTILNLINWLKMK